MHSGGRMLSLYFPVILMISSLTVSTHKSSCKGTIAFLIEIYIFVKFLAIFRYAYFTIRNVGSVILAVYFATSAHNIILQT